MSNDEMLRHSQQILPFDLKADHIVHIGDDVNANDPNGRLMKHEHFVASIECIQVADDMWASWAGGVNFFFTGNKASGKSSFLSWWLNQADRHHIRTYQSNWHPDEVHNLMEQMNTPSIYPRGIVIDGMWQEPTDIFIMHLLDKAKALDVKLCLCIETQTLESWLEHVRKDVRSRLCLIDKFRMPGTSLEQLKVRLSHALSIKGLKPKARMVDYLAHRLDRSGVGLEQAVEMLDQHSLAQGAGMNMPWVRAWVEKWQQNMLK